MIEEFTFFSSKEEEEKETDNERNLLLLLLFSSAKSFSPPISVVYGFSHTFSFFPFSFSKKTYANRSTRDTFLLHVPVCVCARALDLEKNSIKSLQNEYCVSIEMK